MILIRISIKLIYTQYIIFDNDMKNYSFLLNDVYSPDEISENIINYVKNIP
jgi:hypothetical protein